MVERDFKGIWIPKEIWLIEKLSWLEKLILVEIDSLDRSNGCFATNEHFSKFFGISKKSISRSINILVKSGYLISKIIYKKDSKQVEKRILKIDWDFVRKNFQQNEKVINTPSQECGDPLPEIGDTPLPKNEEDNNTIYNNTISNNIYVQNSGGDEKNQKVEKNFERFYKVYPKKKSAVEF